MAKKTFKEDINPAMNFISADTVKAKAEVEGGQEPGNETISELRKKAPEGFKLNPLYVETRSKRIQSLIQPSLYEKIKNRAIKEKTSVNEIINSVLLEAFRDE